MTPFVVLVSGRGSNLRAIVNARETLGGLPVGVVSSRAGVPALAIAQEAGVPVQVVAAEPGESREGYDARLQDAVALWAPQWIVLAGFMRILSDGFLDAWAGRIVNIHPSLLPAFPGLHPHRQALERGVSWTGCTVHLVESGEVDGGRILDQVPVPVVLGDTEETLAARVLAAEHELYPRVLSQLFRGQPPRRSCAC